MAEKKAEYRAYLANSGVMDAIVKSMVVLYEQPEKPSDPIAFIANQLRSAEGTGNCAEKDKQIAELTAQVDNLRAKHGVGVAAEKETPAAPVAPVAPPPETAATLLSGQIDAEPTIAEEAPPMETPAEEAPAPEGETPPAE